MVAESHQPSIPARRLAERLRALRVQEQLTQEQLAMALGGSAASVSLWEKPGPDRMPPPQRLAAYARLFCTRRSFDPAGLRLLRDDELTELEQERKTELYDELIKLRERAQSTDASPVESRQLSSFWQFPDGKAITIVCSEAQPDQRPEYADPSHLNYTPYASFADLNALISVYGQVRANNPASEVRILGKLDHDSALNHLVFIGGAAVAKAAEDQDANAPEQDVERFSANIPLPTAEHIPGTRTHVFICNGRDESCGFVSLRQKGTLVEDVGLIARGPHPNVPGGTVTMLSGITSRGVHGAALCFIDRHLRDSNESYLRAAFGNARAFCILMRVPVRENMAFPPNLSESKNRLYEWSDQDGAYW